MAMNDEIASLGFAALGHKLRVSILRYLVRCGDEGCNIKSLRDALEIPASTMAHHLKIMTDAGLVSSVANGREQLLRPEFQQISAIVTFLMKDCCADSIGRCS